MSSKYAVYSMSGFFGEQIIIRENDTYINFPKLEKINFEKLSKMNKFKYYYFNETDIKNLETVFSDTSYFKNMNYPYIFYISKNENYIFLFDNYFELNTNSDKVEKYKNNEYKYLNELNEHNLIEYNELLPIIRTRIEKEYSNNLIKYLKETKNKENYNRLNDFFKNELSKKNINKFSENEINFILTNGFLKGNNYTIDLLEVRKIEYNKNYVYFYYKSLKNYDSHTFEYKEYELIINYFISMRNENKGNIL